jgi:hypothetical protein
MECELRTTTQNKMKDYHMQQFLAREQLIVGQNVINFDAVKFVSHGDSEGLSANITNNAKEVHLYLMCGKSSQLMVTIADHGNSDHQTSKGVINKKKICDIIVPILSQFFV